METLNEFQIKLAEQLLKSVLKKEPYVYYSDLTNRVGSNGAHGIGKSLEKIAIVCDELSLPLLTAKVVNKQNGKVSPGYFKLYEMFGRPTDGKSNDELVKVERQAIRECREWYRLEEYLGLHIGFPKPIDKEKPAVELKPLPQEIVAEREADDALTKELCCVDFSKNDTEYSDEPRPKATPRKVDGRMIYPRNQAVAKNALARAGFCCEVDGNHTTFIRKNSDKPYTEPHHLIPMAYQDQFDVSLDVEANIVSLCSNCHNHIHYGKGADKLIAKLLSDRIDLLKKAGISVTEKSLLEIYGQE